MQQSPIREKRYKGSGHEGSKGKEKFQHNRTEKAKAQTIIPMNEKQKIYLKALEDEVPVIIATGYAGCVDKDTEFLSQYGWKKIADYQKGDLVVQVSEIGLNASLVEPIRYIKTPCKMFNHFLTDRGIDQVLSDDHNIAYTIKDKNKLNKKLVSAITSTELQKPNGFLGKVPTVYNFPEGKSLNLSENLIRLGVAIKADAYLASESTGRYVFRLKKERKFNRLLNILNSLNKEYTHSYNQDTQYYVVTVYAPEISKKLFDWMFCSKADAQIIMSEYQYWDGDSSPKGNRISRFSTSISTEADALQYFANICGYRASVTESVKECTFITDKKEYVYPESKIYIVNITKQTHLKLCPVNRSTNQITKPTPYHSTDGYKYCFEVSTGYLLLRRNGKVFITGNSSKTYIPTRFACNEYLSDRVYKIVFSRPAISNSKSLGYFAGDKNEKMEIWLAPVLNVVKETLGSEATSIAIKREDILFYPLEIIKGLSLGSTKPQQRLYYIVDEAEDLSVEEVKKIVTRLGKNCTLILAGDVTQSELNDKSGLKWLIDFVKRHQLKNFVHIDFNNVNDIVRSDTVKQFITCLQRDVKSSKEN